MASIETSENGNEKTQQKEPLDKEESTASEEDNPMPPREPQKSWFRNVFKKTAFTIWAIVMAVGVTLAFIASLLLL